MKLCYFVLCCLLIAGCQKKGEKAPPRSIYDQTAIAEALRGAAQDEALFAQFKQNPFVNLLWENATREEGEKWLGMIKERFPFLEEKFERFRQSDGVGSPRVFAFGDAGAFSPSTLRLVAMAGEMQSKVGSWEDLHVVQIGAGYGGLCKIMCDVSECASYTIVDLPEQLALAKKYLEGFGLKNVAFLTPEGVAEGASYDLIVSDRSFSEFNRSYQELFLERIFKRSRAGFIVGHIFPKHYGVVPLDWDKLKGRFEKSGPSCWLEIEEPTIEKEDYLICFKRS